MRTLTPLTLCLPAIILAACSKTDNSTNTKQEGVDAEPLVQFYNQKQVDSLTKTILADSTITRILGKSKDDEQYMIVVRREPGKVEVHEQLDDIAIIRSGHGVLKTGNRVTGETETRGAQPWRNWLGGSIQDAAERKLSAGDFIIIPAMTAHQYIPDAGDTLTYWTIKVNRIKD